MKPDQERLKKTQSLTESLQAWSGGSREARDLVFEEVYSELRSLASLYIKNEGRARVSIQPTLLVNEAYLRLATQTSPWRDRSHFFGVAAQAMRRILVDQARKRSAQKRSAPLFITTAPTSSNRDGAELDVVRLDLALDKLAALDERQAKIVELRYFTGLSIEEAAKALGASPATIKREWSTARAFLSRELRPESAHPAEDLATPERWQDIKQALAGFLELGPEARPARLHELRRRDPELADEVADLAEWDEQKGASLEPRVASRAALAKGSQLFGFEIGEVIGGGGMAEVYEARHLTTSARVALKVFSGAPWNAARRRRFEREARAIGSLNHPNVLGMISFHVDEEGGAVATELLQGEDLRSRLNREALSLDQVLLLAREVARGLGEAHDKGVVHRDLKPENIFIGTDGGARLLDFGLAKIVGESRPGESGRSATSRPGELMGTAAYMSPEQVRTEGVTPASDVFAFGSLLHELLAGRPPFLRETRIDTMFAVVNEEEGSLPAEVGRLSPIVTRCLNKEPAARYASGKELLQALETIDMTRADA